MTDLSPREVAKRAAGAVLWNVRNYPDRAQAAMLGQDTGPLRDKVTDAVLAAVAAHDGLADELRKHRVWGTSGMGVEQVRCSCKGPWMAADEYPAHLADVVRAWLRDQT